MAIAVPFVSGRSRTTWFSMQPPSVPEGCLQMGPLPGREVYRRGTQGDPRLSPGPAQYPIAATLTNAANPSGQKTTKGKTGHESHEFHGSLRPIREIRVIRGHRLFLLFGSSLGGSRVIRGSVVWRRRK